MCGIVGAIAAGGERVDLSGALSVMKHRGPDGSGLSFEAPVNLGHARLSIIDLTDAGAQPMSIDGAGTIAFNGEIYDFRVHADELLRGGIQLRTRSDTEVLLRGLSIHGVDFLERLHGMYAFAWHDRAARRLVLGRDHAGMKPLYFWKGREGFVFASEVRTIAVAMRALGVEPRLDVDSLSEFLQWGSVPEPGAILQGVRQVAASSVIEIALDGSLSMNLRRIRNAHAQRPAEPIEAVRRSVGRAVRRHLVSDRPVAIFLSAGVDSGVIAIEAARRAEALPHAITVRLGTAEADDEPAIVRQLTRRLGIKLDEVSLDDWSTRLDSVFDVYDQPSIDGVNTFIVAGVARELGYRVALSGVGADEVFGGYSLFHGARARVGRWATKPIPIPRFVDGLALSGSPTLRRASIVAEGLRDGEPLQRSWRRVMSRGVAGRLMKLDPSPPTALPTLMVDPLQLERDTYLKDTLLRDTDVMGMAHGVEIRAPFLDPEVLTAAQSIGTDEILRPDRPAKWLLREGWASGLESDTRTRGKTGFSVDMASWIRGPGARAVNGALAGLTERRCVDQAVLSTLVSNARRHLTDGHPAAWTVLFALAQMEHQFRRWGEP